ncbi:type II toxin-antitoxin system RelE/ParE family toxin [Bradyrhizobium sp. HKCCYLS20291]|uniref:type II toxin-antitoxin system RelE/ParE family toxin n=1 Tax=Bradyrhizobium sp. HKCCYLS20291 TaxID=3420766 RepID=UPI003EBFA23F
MPRVFFTDAARGDLEDALSWYEAHAPEIVPRFREVLRVAVKRLGENPKQFPASSHKTRRALLRHFPYLLIFSETASGRLRGRRLSHEPRPKGLAKSDIVRRRLNPAVVPDKLGNASALPGADPGPTSQQMFGVTTISRHT